MPILLKMPKWGLMMKSGTVTEWFRAEGDPVSAGEPLFTVETDKAVNDVEAPGDGVLRRIVAGVGTEVAVTGPVGVIAVGGETLDDDAVAAFVAAQTPRAMPAPAGGGAGARPARAPRVAGRDDAGRITASPAARKLARDLGLDLAAVTATGPGGRITSDDVERAAAGPADEPREDWLAVDDDLRVYVVSAGAPGAPAVVFLHGIGGSSASWQGVIGSFAHTHHVAAIDLPGHGRSDVPDAGKSDYSVAGLARAVTEALRQLELERVTLVGHSLGGAVAAAVALAAPDRVERLVLVDSTGLGDDISPDLVELLDAAPSEAASRALMELFFHDQRLVLDAGVAEHHGALARPGAHAALRAISSQTFTAAGRQAAGDTRLAQITQPVLVVWGEHDRVVPAAHAEAARAVLTDVEVSIIPGTGHAPQVEDPATFAEVLARFLAGE
jgi:pyruvate dehydrogenase E2 component (dihydrolipoamide acetyltransferase)